MTRTAKSEILVSGACVFRDNHGKIQWFIVKEVEKDNWEFAKTIVRKGESSVRAILRIMGEKGAMSTRIIEEAGRVNGVGEAQGKTLPQRTIYYLILAKKMSGEPIGFGETSWMEFSQATKKLATKREIAILKSARDEMKVWQKKREKRRKLLGLPKKKI